MRFLVYDTGLATEHAICLRKHGHEVRYFTPWNDNFPRFKNYAVGMGMDGMEKVLHFFSDIDWADCIVFFDTGMGDLATFLRSKGYNVFGAGLRGEQLENHRYYARKVQQDLGLPTQNTRRVMGTQAVKAALSENPDLIVKHDIFRADLETFKPADPISADQILNTYSSAVGPFHDRTMFILEEPISGIEPGFDMFYGKQGWVKPYFYGYESKSAYIGRVSETLPPALDILASKIDKHLKNLDYRAAMSVEAIIEDKSKEPYLIDITARMPFPLSSVYTELYSNYPEMIYSIAAGKPVTAKTTAKYAGCLPLECEYALENWVPVNFDKKYRSNVKFKAAAQVDGHYYAVPGMSNIVNVCALGNSVDEVIDIITKVVDEIKAHDLDGQNAAGSLAKIKETISAGEKAGIPFHG